MLRKIAGLLAVVLLTAGLAAAEDKKDSKEPKFIFGTFESYKKETLTLKVDGKEKEYMVPGDTPVGYTTGNRKEKAKVLKARVHLKDVKKGSYVTVTVDDKNKVLGVGVVVAELPRDEDKDEDRDKDK